MALPMKVSRPAPGNHRTRVQKQCSMLSRGNVLPGWRNLDTEPRHLCFHLGKLGSQRKPETLPCLQTARQHMDVLDSVFPHRHPTRALTKLFLDLQ